MRVYLPICVITMAIFGSVCSASAVDVKAMDRVSVLMPKAQVLSVLGTPDTVADMGGLMVDLYTVNHADPLVSAGYFYEKNAILAGHTYIFKGNLVARSAARLKTLGFVVQEEQGEYVRLTGNDDDTGRPMVVVISRINDLTTVTSFEKGFYERRATR